MGNKLDALKRKQGSIPAKTTYDERKGTDWNELGEKINTTQETRKINNKVDNQDKTIDTRKNIKISEALKTKIDAQKQVMGIKYDYQLIELLLDRNFETFSDKQKSTYKVVVELLENQ